MKNKFKKSLLLAALLLIPQVNANEYNTEKHWSVGVGTYAFSVTSDNNNSRDIDFSGFNIAGAYAVNNHFQIRATYFSLENDDFDSIESTGFDIMAYGGTGFSEKGFRGYGGGGFYSDKWSLSGADETYSGIQLGGGLGYNWGAAALDFVVTLREADEYEDYYYLSGTYVAASGNLTMSYLF